MEKISQKNKGFRLKVIKRIVHQVEVALNGAMGYGRPELSEMRYLAQMHITDQKDGFFLPKKYARWMEDESLCFNRNWVGIH
jgi:hypothetical protein